MIDEHQLISSGKVLEKTMDFSKFQIAFNETPTEQLFWSCGLDVKSLKIVGRVATVVVAGDSAQAEEEIQKLNPLIVDKLDVNFEEAFIGDIDKRIRGGEA